MKKIKKEIKCAYQSDYCFPGPKYAEKLIEKEEKFRWKIRELRYADISKQNEKFDLNNEENIRQLLNVSDISHKKYLEYVTELQKVEAEVETWGLAEKYPDYCIKAAFYVAMLLPDDNDFYCRLISDYSRKDSKFEFDDDMLNKKFCTPIRGLIYHDISYPFYCMVEEHKLSFKEAMNLTEENFYWEIKIELK